MSILVVLSVAIFAIFLSFAIFMVSFYNWRWPSHRKLCRKLPGPKMLSIIGVGLDLIMMDPSELVNYVDNLWKQFGPIFYTEWVGLPSVFLVDSQDLERVFNNNQNITKGFPYQSLVPWLSEGLLTSTGDKWRMRRKILTPSLHLKILENFIPIFNRNAKLLTEKLISAKGSAVDLEHYLSLCTLDIICETAMGTKLDAQKGAASEYVSTVNRASEIVLKRCITFWMMNDFFFNITPIGREFRRHVEFLHRFTEKVIKERKINYQRISTQQEETEIGKQTKRRSLLDCLIEMQKETPNEMTDRDIREEVDTFMYAGQDTLTGAITWTLFLIACHKDVQTKLQEEMQQVFGDSDRDATIQDTWQLNYLEMVIKESLRLYPSAAFISRLLTTNLKIRDYIIPPNTNVVIIPYLVHRNPNIFPDPEKFIPERFLPHIAKERHPYAYIPFSAGPRNCIAQKFANLEEKIIISTILRKLRLNTEMKRDELKIIPQVTLRSDPKIKIRFTPYEYLDNDEKKL